MSTKRVAVGKELKTNFDQILRLTVTSLRLVGIPLDPFGIKPKLFRYWSIVFGLLIFLLNLVANIGIFVKSVQNRMSKPMMTGDWNFIINSSCIVVTLVGVHLALLTCTVPNWKDVLTVFRQIDELNLFGPDDYKKFRKMFLNGIIISITAVVGSVALAIFVSFSSSDELMHPIQCLLVTHLAFGLTLYMTLGWTISTVINILGKRTHLLVSDNNDRWCRCYGLIVKLISLLNVSFGPCLLLVLLFYFIFLVNGSFIALVGFRERGLLDEAALSVAILEITLFAFFLIFLYIPHRIIQEAHQLAGNLFLFYPRDDKARQLARQMELRVLLSPIHITAMGLVIVDLNLVPTILGTCLTYIIVMVQFKVSESGPAPTFSSALSFLTNNANTTNF